MAGNANFGSYSSISAGVTVKLDLTKYAKRLKRAQFALDSRIMTDMVPRMPIVTGNFIQNTRARSAALAGTGTVCAAAPPFGRYLYKGNVMVDSKTGKGPMNIPGVGPRFRKGARLVAIDRPLTYGNPKATPEWFETAKKENLKEWVNDVEDELIGRK